MMNNKILGILLMAMSSYQFHAQTNNLTGSPYSVFGLGVQSNSNLAGFSGFGNTGIAYQGKSLINPYNSAALASIQEKSFLFDIGLNAEVSILTDRSDEEPRITSNFSNVAFGFNANGKWGIGFTLTPATNVGYTLIGLQSDIEGSGETFTSNVIGSGGINEIKFDFGHRIFNRLNLGIAAAYLFGSIDESENIRLIDSSLLINEENVYSGFQLGLGMQYNLTEKFTLGATSKFPSVLKGTQNRNVVKSLNTINSLVEDEEDLNIDDFTFPFQFGVGLSTSYFSNLTLNIDYHRKLWDATNQFDAIGKYTDQSIFGIGGEIVPKKNGFKFWQRINYRIGFSYDTGNLEINDTSIEKYKYSLGLGIPMGKGNSMINISYNFINNGVIQGILIEENTHLFNVNLTLSDVWFLKRQYD
ncbi:MAG: hypothetical protein AAF489_11820 [Bacteroidota bacterium]